MISKEELKEVLKKGGDILQYLLLNYVNMNIDIEDIKQNIKITGVISLMIKKDLIQLLNDGKYLITEKGKEFLNLEKEDNNKEANLMTFKNTLSERLENKIGKKQIKGFGDVYFIPTISELQVHLGRFWKKYPTFTDLDKIEKILINHIESCCKRNSFAPAIKYFIYKDTTGGFLGAAYENFEEEQKEEAEELIKKDINTKELF